MPKSARDNSACSRVQKISWLNSRTPAADFEFTIGHEQHRNMMTPVRLPWRGFARAATVSDALGRCDGDGCRD